jgi:hypothetical protein
VRTFVSPLLRVFPAPLRGHPQMSVDLADGHLLDDTGLHGSSAGGGDRWLAGLLLEDLPELERLVGGGGSEHLTIGAEAAVQDARLVGRNLHVLDARRVAPDAEAVVGEATAADNLLVVSTPAEASHLRVGWDVVDASTSGGVPEVDLTVIGTTTGSEEVGLPRAPGESLDGSAVVGLGELGGGKGARIPDVHHVVITASRELGTVGAPLETANLTSVRDELGDLVLGDADVVVVDEAGTSASREEMLVPAHDADAGLMAEHAAKLGLLLDVPDLDLTRAETDTNVGAVT